MFQIRLVQTIFSIEILQLKSVLISFDINTFHFSLHINELNTVENSSHESNPVPTSILILAGRGSLRRCSGNFGSSRIYFRLITSGSVNSHSLVTLEVRANECVISPKWQRWNITLHDGLDLLEQDKREDWRWVKLCYTLKFAAFLSFCLDSVESPRWLPPGLHLNCTKSKALEA